MPFNTEFGHENSPTRLRATPEANVIESGWQRSNHFFPFFPKASVKRALTASVLVTFMPVLELSFCA